MHSILQQQIDFYKLLGISQDANDKEIKRAYRKACKRWHPDKNRAPEATERFQQIKEAYDVLSDGMSRLQYDVSLDIQTLGLAVSKPVSSKATRTPYVAEVERQRRRRRRRTKKKKVGPVSCNGSTVQASSSSRSTPLGEQCTGATGCNETKGQEENEKQSKKLFKKKMGRRRSKSLSTVFADITKAFAECSRSRPGSNRHRRRASSEA